MKALSTVNLKEPLFLWIMWGDAMKKTLVIWVVAFLLTTLLCGCGKARDDERYEGESYYDITNGKNIDMGNTDSLPIISGKNSKEYKDYKDKVTSSTEKDLSEPSEHVPGEDPWELPIA